MAWGLQQQAGTEPNNVFDNVVEIAAAGNRWSIWARMRSTGNTLTGTGMASSARVGSSAGSPRPSYFSTATWTPPLLVDPSNGEAEDSSLQAEGSSGSSLLGRQGGRRAAIPSNQTPAMVMGVLA
jgi:hypothetical protein